MPLVRIDLIRGRSEEDIAAIGESVQRALVETLGVPERDRFQVISEHAPGRLVYDRSCLGVERTDDFVLVQVTLSRGRTTGQKQAFYARLAELLARNARMGPEDVAISRLLHPRGAA